MNLSNIINASQKPVLYAKGTYIMWRDNHISRQLLAVHLDENIDLASRKKSTIDKTVNWILKQTDGKKLSILDLGCGPGLYAEILSGHGHKVTGIDFSKHSIEYATKEAKKKNFDITYFNKNYLELDFENEFDLVMMIYTDFGVLLPDERDKLLSIVHKALKPGGKFIFDVINDKHLEQKVTPNNWEVAEKGFWKDEPYLTLSNSFLYEKEKVILYQHVVNDEQGTVKVYRFWTHHFSDDDLFDIFKKHEFTEITCHKDVLPGNDLWNGDNITFTVANKK